MRSPRSQRILTAAVIGAAGLLAATPAAGASTKWTIPQTFADADAELAMRAAIATDGTGAVAWPTRKRAFVVSTGRPDGHFDAPRQIHRGRPNDWSVAAAPRGAFLVAWSDRDGLAIAVRSATGRRIVVRRVLSALGIDSVQVAADPRGGWVIVTSGPRVRGLSLDQAGHRLGPTQDLGAGGFGFDSRQTQALAVDPDGRAVFAFVRADGFGGGAAVVSTRTHGGGFAEPALVPGPATAPRVALGPGGRAVLAVTRTEACAESGCFGAPAITVLNAAGVPMSAFGPALDRPDRAIAPTAALTTANHGVLVFAMKTKPSPFSRDAPVRAATFATDGSVGPLQTLTSELASEPVVQPLSGGRALALWATSGAIGAALAGPDGRFHATAAPAGRPPGAGHTNPTNRDLHTAGRHALFAWDSNGRLRVSTRRF